MNFSSCLGRFCYTQFLPVPKVTSHAAFDVVSPEVFLHVANESQHRKLGTARLTLLVHTNIMVCA